MFNFNQISLFKDMLEQGDFKIGEFDVLILHFIDLFDKVVKQNDSVYFF